MGPWQFRVRLLPVEGLRRICGSVPAALSAARTDITGTIDERVDWDVELLKKLWKEYDGKDVLVSEVCSFLPERESWSEFARMFGDSKADEIQVWMDEVGNLQRIDVSVSLADPNRWLIRGIVEMARKRACAFLSIQNGEVFLPSIDRFVARALESSASRYIPEGRALLAIIGQ